MTTIKTEERGRIDLYVSIDRMTITAPDDDGRYHIIVVPEHAQTQYRIDIAPLDGTLPAFTVDEIARHISQAAPAIAADLLRQLKP